MVSTHLSIRPTLIKRTWRCGSYFIGLLVLLVSVNTVAARLISEVDRSAVNLGESFELNVIFSKQTMFGEPDFSPLEKDFKILSRNRRSQYSNINGQSVSTTRWVLNLSPKRIGNLLVPSLTFKGEVSNALEINVRKAKASTQVAGAAVFTETLLDKSSVFVQEQALLTLRLYTSVPMSNFAIDELAVPQAQLIKVAESQYQKDLDGQQYTVVETRYAIFADSSSTLEIPAIQYRGVIAERSARRSGSLFQQRGRQAFFNSEAKQLQVKPMPSNHTLQHWLPARGLGLAERWSNAGADITLGEPLTRTITQTGQGLLGSQLPPLQMPASKSYKLYPDQPQMENNVSEAGVIGQRIESIAIVPTQVGSITLPDISVDWWDSEANEVRQTVLKGRTLNVLPPSGATELAGDEPLPTELSTTPGPTAMPLPGTGTPLTGIYFWLLGASNLVWLIVATSFAVLWWRNRPGTEMAVSNEVLAVSDKALFKEIRMACAIDNYPALRQAIINWARLRWQQEHLHSLEQVAELANDDALKAEFKALDARLYSKDDAQQPVSSDTIFRQLDSLRKNGEADSPATKKDRRQHLQTLYPKNS
ncbi:MAG: protein BatD [Gammaproteobacteria bacterium]|nr:protein BatD [Gammaproteobacteria bacterium]MBQ0840404.1 protein BatD [Gammaproteobacteria bacterium]